MIPGSRLLDASPHKINWQQTVEIAKDYEFLVLFTSTVGFESDVKLLRKIKESNPSLKVAFVGPHGHIRPDETLNASEDIDFIVRGEFDHAVTEYAHGKALDQILGASYKKDGKIVHNAPRPQLHTEELDALPFASDVYKRDLADRTLQRSVSAESIHLFLFLARLSGAVYVLHVATDAIGTCVARALGRQCRGRSENGRWYISRR